MNPTMTPTATAAAPLLAAKGALAAATTLAPGVPLNTGEAESGPFELAFEYAVVVPLGGGVDGELALFVDDDFGRALAGADGGLDLAAALGPALQQVAAALGPAVLGRAAAVDARMAQSRVTGYPDVAVVALDDGNTVRAAVAVGVNPAAAATPPAVMPPTGGNERLDLLRHVEMAATVELGRARMTINDLLSLRDGAIVELDRAAGEPADLLVNGRLIARGEIVVVDENYALRVTHIVTDETGR